MTPLVTIGFGIAQTGERLDTRMIAETVLAPGGVLIVALRRPTRAVLGQGERA